MLPANNSQETVARELKEVICQNTFECSIVEPLSILAAGGVPIVEQLSDKNWVNFCSKIDKQYKEGSDETVGVRDMVQQLFVEINNISGNLYRLDFERNSIVHDSGTDHIPELVFMFDRTNGDMVGSLVMQVGVSKFHDLQTASDRAINHLIRKLRDQLDLYGFNKRLHGFSVAADGLSFALNYVSIINDELIAYSTGDGPIVFWPNNIIHNDPSTYPPVETEGLRILRSLLSQPAAQLGLVTTPPPSHKTRNWVISPMRVLGRGSFFTALLATVTSTAPTTEVQQVEVVLKRINIDAMETQFVLDRLKRECDTLRRFNTSDCPNLPNLFDGAVEDGEITAAAPFIPLQPVGQDLRVRCAALAPSERLQETLVIYEHITTGLRAVHAVGYCHRNLSPDNVVYNPANSCYVVMGWGSAEPPGTITHFCVYQDRMCKPFQHDDIVTAMHEGTRIPYQPEHDVGAARYVTFVFSQGPTFTTRSWDQLSVGFVATRARIVGDFCT